MNDMKSFWKWWKEFTPVAVFFAVIVYPLLFIYGTWYRSDHLPVGNGCIEIRIVPYTDRDKDKALEDAKRKALIPPKVVIPWDDKYI